jgi:hypothetical protein
VIRRWSVCLAASVAVGVALAGPITDSERKMVTDVFTRLAASTAPPVGFPSWPPVLGFIEDETFNAFATFDSVDGKQVPVVKVYAGIIHTGWEGNADRAALVLGHELAHHILGHTGKGRSETEFLTTTFTREQEFAADTLGMELMLKAGFSFKGGIGGFRRCIELKLEYSSFEGLGYDHPSWGERIAALDKQQAQLWRAMGAFDSASYFLLTQQYGLAERALRSVTKEFPDAYDAWANLGYALLMQYADALDPNDLRKYDLGQIVVGGFYRRPGALAAKIRGINEELWWEAVGALREAIRLNPNQALAKANLGVAYLIGPQGKEPGKAVPLLEEARTLAANDTGLDPGSLLALAVNLAVAYGAGGNDAEFQKLLDLAENAVKSAASEQGAGLASTTDAIAYNRAVAAAKSGDSAKQQQAVTMFERYLRSTSSASAWWTLAYERYAALCQALAATAKTRESLAQRPEASLRPIASIKLGKSIVAIGDKLVDTQKLLGPGTMVPVVAGTNLVRISYPNYGVELLATDQVLAIQMVAEVAPALPLQSKALASSKRELKIGMTVEELDAALGELASSFDFRPLADPNIKYRFYSELGLAVRVKQGKVIEIALAMIPKAHVI